MGAELFTKENGIFVGTVIVTILAYIINEVKKLVDKRKKKRKENFIYQAQKDHYIDEILIDIKSRFQCDATSIFQFHNGSHFKSQDPLKFLSMTHEVVDPSFRRYQDDAQYIQIYKYNKSFLKVCEEKIIVCDLDTSLDWYMKQELALKGLGTVVWAIIEGYQNKPIGILALYYIDKHEEFSESEKREIINEASMIGFKLSEY